jgi:hypothetical protein
MKAKTLQFSLSYLQYGSETPPGNGIGSFRGSVALIASNAFAYSDFIHCPDCMAKNFFVIKSFAKDRLCMCNFCNAYFFADNIFWRK